MAIPSVKFGLDRLLLRPCCSSKNASCLSTEKLLDFCLKLKICSCDSFHVGPALKFLLRANNFLSSGLAERFGLSEKWTFLCGYCAIRTKHQTVYSSTVLCMDPASCRFCTSWLTPGGDLSFLGIQRAAGGESTSQDSYANKNYSRRSLFFQEIIQWFSHAYGEEALTLGFCEIFCTSPLFLQFTVSCDEFALWIVSLSAQYS